jgi:hypothetical protein
MAAFLQRYLAPSLVRMWSGVSPDPRGAYDLTMPAIRVEAASAVPWADVEHSLTGGGDGGSCWCQ